MKCEILAQYDETTARVDQPVAAAEDTGDHDEWAALSQHELQHEWGLEFGIGRAQRGGL